MDNQDERASNLLLRLFAYAPRVGRQALEDYCTEALAWCLGQSPEFLVRFLNLTGISSLHDWAEPADVHTQMGFTGTDLEDIGEEPVGGRFDLVIQSGVAKPFVLVVESKVGSEFGRDQLRNYRDELNATDAFPGVPKDSRYLVTLTTRHHASLLTDGKSLTWPQVFGVVTDSPHPSDPCVAGLFSQFGAFLKEKGLAMLELKKTDARTLAQWFEVKEFESQLMQIIERLRNQDELKAVIGRRQVKPEGEDWVGVSGNNDFWAGFGLDPELYLWVEITVPGDRRKLSDGFDSEMNAAFNKARHYLEAFEGDDSINRGNLVDGNSRFVFAKSMIGELDGDGEATFAWLYDMSKKALALK